MTSPTTGAMAETRRAALLGPVLILTTMVVSVISSLGAPLIPDIAQDDHVSLSDAQWSLTVALLSGAVAAPVMGRLGDGRRRRETLIGGVAAVTLGCALSAVAPSLGLLIVGRALQGFGLGLVPLTMASARDGLPPAKATSTIAILSVSAAAGVGAGYPISGLVADQFGLSGAYWFGALVGVVALVFVVWVIPSSAQLGRAKMDFVGVSLLTGGLIALLIGIAQGDEWHWGSPTVLGLFAGAVVLLVAWVLSQLRTELPLVELRLLRHSAVLTGNVCAFVLGSALYMQLSALTEFVQAPKSDGFGFSASVVVAGMCLIPFAVLSLFMSRLLPGLTRLLGSGLVLAAGSLLVAAAGAFFALWNGSLWEAFFMMGLVGLGSGLTFAAIPGLIVRAIPQHETGSAMGFYQVVRYVGFSLGSALTASILASHTPASSSQPTKAGFTVVMWISAVICAAAAALAAFLKARSPAPIQAEPLPEQTQELLEEATGEATAAL